MKCEAVADQLVAYAYDEMDAQQRADVESHLRQCDSCRKDFERMARTVALLNEAAELNPAPSKISPARIERMVVERSTRRRRWVYRAAVVAASLAAVLVVANVMSLRVQFHADHVEIGWGNDVGVQAVTSEPATVPGSWEPDLAEHEARLDDLDNLVHLLVQSAAADGRSRERDVLLLAQQIESLRMTNESRWRTLVLAVRTMQSQPTEPTSIRLPD